jgi:acetyl esterase/lipase
MPFGTACALILFRVIGVREMPRRILQTLATFAVAIPLLGQSRLNLPFTVPLWPNGAPGALGTSPADQPSLTVFPISGPQKVPTGVVVFPGGGYVHLAMDHEGQQIAAWLNSYGITAFVVQYRLGPLYHYPAEFQDGQRAVRWARAHAAGFGIDPHRIGVWGFSAGGHLASTVATHFDNGKPDSADPVERESSRPDFLILAYPVITFEEPYLHRGSRNALLGPNPNPSLVELLSNEKHVTADTPPAFLFQTSDDPVVPVQNSVEFYLALRAAGVPAEMHIYEHGPHGVGLARNHPELASWPHLLADWLRARGLR